MNRRDYENRKALCHPKRKHEAKGMCAPCYRNYRNARQNDVMANLVRVNVKGWGCL